MVTFHSYVKLPEGIQIDFIGMTSGNISTGHQSVFLISNRGFPLNLSFNQSNDDKRIWICGAAHWHWKYTSASSGMYEGVLQLGYPRRSVALNTHLVAGWAYPSEKYEFVSSDDDIPNWMEEQNSCSSHHQPVMLFNEILWFQTQKFQDSSV